jgi:hypothetical protein
MGTVRKEWQYTAVLIDTTNSGPCSAVGRWLSRPDSVGAATFGETAVLRSDQSPKAMAPKFSRQTSPSNTLVLLGVSQRQVTHFDHQ